VCAGRELYGSARHTRPTAINTATSYTQTATDLAVFLEAGPPVRRVCRDLPSGQARTTSDVGSRALPSARDETERGSGSVQPSGAGRRREAARERGVSAARPRLRARSATPPPEATAAPAGGSLSRSDAHYPTRLHGCGVQRRVGPSPSLIEKQLFTPFTPIRVWGLVWGICANEPYPAQTFFWPNSATSLEH
jgi:hypothetical protein